MNGTSICLVTMDRPRVLEETVDALTRSLRPPYEVIVVDNGSRDEATLAELSRQEQAGWTVIRNRKNLGLSRATNQGLAAAKHDCLIHMDDDAVVTAPDGWNQIMADYFDIPEVGLVMPKTDGDAIPKGRYREVRWGFGMCWSIRKSLFEEIGGYDPQLVHQNECDLCLRVRLAGYDVAGIDDLEIFHNDPGGPRSEMSLAREHFGTYQFRDKYCQYFRGRRWNGGTQPLYLMPHWPPDEDFYRRFAEHHGVNLNPHPTVDLPPGSVLGLVRENAPVERLEIDGRYFLAMRVLRNDYAFWSNLNDDLYAQDRQKAIDRWFDLTGERYIGYDWGPNLWKPPAVGGVAGGG